MYFKVKDATRKIAKKFEISGPFNTQFLAKDGKVMVRYYLFDVRYCLNLIVYIIYAPTWSHCRKQIACIKWEMHLNLSILIPRAV